MCVCVCVCVCVLKWSIVVNLTILQKYVESWINQTLKTDLPAHWPQWSGRPGRVIPKTLKMLLDISLLNTRQYKVRIKGKVEQSWERISALPYTSV